MIHTSSLRVNPYTLYHAKRSPRRMIFLAFSFIGFCLRVSPATVAKIVATFTNGHEQCKTVPFTERYTALS